MTRRDLLGLLGAGVAGSVLAGCGASGGPSAQGPGAAAKEVRTFHSRPDLKPPVVEVTRPVGLPGAGYILITPGGPLMVDNRGSPVWYHPVPHASTNLRVQRLRGQPVLTWWEGEITHYGVGHSGADVILDRRYREVMRVKAELGDATEQAVEEAERPRSGGSPTRSRPVKPRIGFLEPLHRT